MSRRSSGLLGRTIRESPRGDGAGKVRTLAGAAVCTRDTPTGPMGRGRTEFILLRLDKTRARLARPCVKVLEPPRPIFTRQRPPSAAVRRAPSSVPWPVAPKRLLRAARLVRATPMACRLLACVPARAVEGADGAVVLNVPKALFGADPRAAGA